MFKNILQNINPGLEQPHGDWLIADWVVILGALSL